ncbi:MAG: HEAT repeat domain-containing protein [Planctomycetaceae bacterium]|nr:HEAT repeat domain-containing protein [Planctomycetaceae bacterium]
MFRRVVAAAVVGLTLSLSVCVADDSMWAGLATQPVPEGAKVTLEVDRPDCLLGENVLVHFILENTGDKPFEASFGGDYRGASRHLRFKVTATDEAGQPAEDPDPFPMCMGGIGGPRTLNPGEKFVESLPLMRYCQIERPGLYTIRATHDFGWKEDDRKRPVGETTITFRMPDSRQAAEIVNEMAHLPDRPDSVWGERSTAYADFCCLRHPVYLDILAERARGGDKRAFEGLGLIPTVKATEMLIQLAGDSDREVALGAANTLNNRLPYPDSHYVPASPGSSKEPQLSLRGRLVERAWDEKLVPSVRALAARLLASGDSPTVTAAAFMIVSVGTKEDAPAVLAAVNSAHNTTFNPRTRPEDNILDLPQPVWELLRAMDTLRARGFALGEHVSGDAEILLYFRFLNGAPAPRPERWPAMLEAFGTSGWYPIRGAAVRSIPQPVSKKWTDFVIARLEDRDLGVCRAACTAAGASGNPAFIRPLLDIVATEHHEWLLREASSAAETLGAGFALRETWADRLAEAGLYPLALDSLQTVLEVPTGSYSGRTDLSRDERLKLREAWKEFLAQHGEEIRAGKRFQPSDPAVTPALAGRARSWQLEDGTTWPKPSNVVAPN